MITNQVFLLHKRTVSLCCFFQDHQSRIPTARSACCPSHAPPHSEFHKVTSAYRKLPQRHAFVIQKGLLIELPDRNDILYLLSSAVCALRFSHPPYAQRDNREKVRLRSGSWHGGHLPASPPCGNHGNIPDGLLSSLSHCQTSAFS